MRSGRTGQHYDRRIASLAQYRKRFKKARRYKASIRRARVGAVRHQDRAAEVERYCFFLGFQRSGTSLVGQLLNAHRHVVISHESDVLRMIDTRGATRSELFGMILENDKAFVRRGAKGGGGYEFGVPGQWQGTAERLRVIGDKKAGASATRLGSNPALLDQLREIVAVPIRIISLVRNPFDNISTIARRTEVALEDAVEVYFRLAADVASTSARTEPGELLRVRLEDVVRDTRLEMARLCHFLDVDAPDDYLDACASKVFDAPRRTRDAAPWTPGLIADVERRIAEVDFLAGYVYDA
jgi:hypothetical protein